MVLVVMIFIVMILLMGFAMGLHGVIGRIVLMPLEGLLNTVRQLA